MRLLSISDDTKYSEKPFLKEKELTAIFNNNYTKIISENSFWFNIEKQMKSKTFKNFKHSICDGFLLIWDNPTTPTLYITEIELEEHPVNTHILPQIGNFISFIQSATIEELNFLRNILYQKLKDNNEVFERIQKMTKREVYELLDNAMQDLQILLIINKIKPELSIGLSQIEKAINVKIRKVEVKHFVNKNKDECILYNDSEEIEYKESAPVNEESEYSLDYHIDGKPDEIIKIVNDFIKFISQKEIRISPTKHYIGFFKNNAMIFSCVVRKNSVIFYSKAVINAIKINELETRDVRTIGHYTNHLPTEIVITESENLKFLFDYFVKLYNKY